MTGLRSDQVAGRLIRIAKSVAIAFALFLMLFSLDVFGIGGSVLQKIAGFLIHSLPSLAIAAILALTWHDPFRSGLSFLLLAVLFAFMFRAYGRIDTFIMLSGVPGLIGVLFLLASRRQGAESSLGSGPSKRDS